MSSPSSSKRAQYVLKVHYADTCDTLYRTFSFDPDMIVADALVLIQQKGKLKELAALSAQQQPSLFEEVKNNNNRNSNTQEEFAVETDSSESSGFDIISWREVSEQPEPVFPPVAPPSLSLASLASLSLIALSASPRSFSSATSVPSTGRDHSEAAPLSTSSFVSFSQSDHRIRSPQNPPAVSSSSLSSPTAPLSSLSSSISAASAVHALSNGREYGLFVQASHDSALALSVAREDPQEELQPQLFSEDSDTEQLYDYKSHTVSTPQHGTVQNVSPDLSSFSSSPMSMSMSFRLPTPLANFAPTCSAAFVQSVPFTTHVSVASPRAQEHLSSHCTAQPSAASLQDHPVDTHNYGRYLLPELTLSQSRIPLVTEVVFRPLTQPLKVRDFDGTLQKTVLVRSTMNVSKLLISVARRFGVRHISEYSLQYLHGDAWVWMPPRAVLYRLIGDPSGATVIFRKRLFMYDPAVRRSDTSSLHFMFIEARNAVIDAVVRVTKEQAVYLAALQMQVTYQNYDPLVHVAGFLNQNEFLPHHYHDDDLLEEEVFEEHRKLCNVSDVECKYRYIQQCLTFRNYGMASFYVRDASPASQFVKQKCILGVKSNCLVCLHSLTRDQIYSDSLMRAAHMKVNAKRKFVSWRYGAKLRAYVFKTTAHARNFHNYYIDYLGAQNANTIAQLPRRRASVV